ncbi:hypothetical protein GQ457_12G027510 [Hibiscus cannabinus]
MARESDIRSWRGKNQQIFTLFVENLPEKLHWQGLRHAFGRFGDVLDAFIASKRNRRGRRFGRRIDAEKNNRKDERLRVFWKED